MNILCVCGNGIGTSVLLKINVEQAADNLGMDVNVTTSDAGSAKGTANMSDLVLTSPQLAPELEGTTTPVETVENFMDLDEITGILVAHGSCAFSIVNYLLDMRKTYSPHAIIARNHHCPIATIISSQYSDIST